MALPERTNGIGDCFPVVQVLDRDGEHLHQLLALLGHVVLEEMPQLRIALEELVVEHHGGGVGDRLDFGKAGSDEQLLGRGQRRVSSRRLSKIINLVRNLPDCEMAPKARSRKHWDAFLGHLARGANDRGRVSRCVSHSTRISRCDC
jgi:hypothetical protein